MRAILGVVSLLVVVAIVGVLASRQLKAVNKSVGATMPPAQAGVEQPTTAPPANVREQSQQIQQRVTSDIQKSMEQGAARNEAADK